MFVAAAVEVLRIGRQILLRFTNLAVTDIATTENHECNNPYVPPSFHISKD